MALIFQPVHTINFSTDAGSRIVWEVDLLRSYEENTTPPWFVGGNPPPVTRLVAAGSNPLTTTWHNDRDTYKPINGSSTQLNLIARTQAEADLISSFNAASEYEYQLRVRSQGEGISGGQRVIGGLYGDIADDGATTTGNGDVVSDIGSLLNLQVNLNRNTSSPLINESAAGRNLYASTDGGVNVFFVGTIDATTVENLGSTMRIRISRGDNDATAVAEINDNVNPGAEVWLADEGDTGTSTTFAGASMLPFWCGFIQPMKSSEQASSFPKPFNITALDGLGGLEDSQIPLPTTEDDIVLFNVILEALYSTGLNLPVRVDSGIRSTISGGTVSDSLLIAQSGWNSFLRKRRNERQTTATYKDAVNGILSAFNCNVKQSLGAWYITNNSTHGGTGVNEETTFDTYVVLAGGTEYSAAANYTEDLLSTVGGVGLETRDLTGTPSFKRGWRRPVGSVECRPADLTEVDFASNGNFGGNTGWTPSGGIDSTLTYDTVNFLNGGRSITTSRNRRIIRDSTDRWFRNENGYNVSVNGDIDISFAWRHTRDSNLSDVQLSYQIYVDLPEAVAVEFLDLTTYNITPNTATRVYWNPGLEMWSFQDTSFMRGFRKNIISTDEGSWERETVTLPALSTGTSFYGGLVSSGSLFIQFFYPQAKSTITPLAGYRDNGVGRLTVNVDDIIVQNMFGEEVIDPVFERTQSNYKQTITYEPLFASEIDEAIVQHIDLDTYFRKGNTIEQAAPVSLEEIGTQQRLNDYRTRYIQWSGGLINNNTVPYAPHNKVGINFTTQNEPVNGIFKSGSFNYKENRWNVLVGIPNQTTDIAATRRGNIANFTQDGNILPGFYTQNIELIGSKFPGRSENNAYIARIDVIGLDDNGQPMATNPLSSSPAGLRFTDRPGRENQGKIYIEAAAGFELNASNLSIVSTNDNEIPRYITFPSLAPVFVQQGTGVELAYIVTQPEASEYEVLTIQGEVDPFIADNRSFDLTFQLDSSVTGAMISSTSRTLRGPVESVSFTNVIISPTAGRQLNAGTFSAGALPAGVTLLGFSQLGTSVLAEFSVEIQPTNQVETIMINGSASTLIPDTNVMTSTITLSIAESNADGGVAGINNVSLSRTFLTLTGIQGSTAVYDVFAYAADGFTVTPSNFSGTESLSWLSVGNAAGKTQGEAVIIPLTITFPTTDSSGTVTINGSAQAVESTLENYNISITNNIGNTSLSESTETLVLEPGQTQSYVTEIRGNAGYNLQASNVTITGTSGWSTFNSGNDIVQLRRTVTGGTTATNDSITLSLNGEITREPYTLQVNLTNNVTNTMLSTSILTAGYDDADIGTAIPGLTLLFSIQSNADTMAFTSLTQVTTPTNGGLSVTYTGGVGTITGVVNGNFPQPDDAGLAIVNLEINPALATGTPPLAAATSANWTQGSAVEYDYTDNGTVQIPFTANGLVNVIEAGSGGVVSSGVEANLSFTLSGGRTLRITNGDEVGFNVGDNIFFLNDAGQTLFEITSVNVGAIGVTPGVGGRTGTFAVAVQTPAIQPTLSQDSSGNGFISIALGSVTADSNTSYEIRGGDNTIGTLLDSIVIRRRNVIREMVDVSVDLTGPFFNYTLTGSNDGAPTVFQYTDSNGQRRVEDVDGVTGVLTPNFETVCAAENSVTVITGSGTFMSTGNFCGLSVAQDSESVNGFTIQTLTVAPPAGTADTIITIVRT